MIQYPVFILILSSMLANLIFSNSNFQSISVFILIRWPTAIFVLTLELDSILAVAYNHYATGCAEKMITTTVLYL